MADLFSPKPDQSDSKPIVDDLGKGVFHIKQAICPDTLLQLTHDIIKQAPLRQMMTPMGHLTKASMSNCADYGWVSDLSGYRYSARDPLTHKAWPSLPAEFLNAHHKACELVGITPFEPDACLINAYNIGQSMGRHQDKDELNLEWPIVSISLGLPAIFQVFGNQRNGQSLDIFLQDGDILILSGESRLYYHGVKPIKLDPLNPNLNKRFNLTLRKSH
ncbi:MAG: alpha-ketoglutarate-dependent dioxygenase AlkB [Bermanella sp.]